MRETSQRVIVYLLDMIDSLKFQQELKNSIYYFFKKRYNKPLLKPYLIRLTFELVGDGNWENIIPFCALGELLNISSYQSNLAFDNKTGLLTKEEKDNQFIASTVTREVCNRIVHTNNYKLSAVQKNNILNMISVANLYIYKAQYHDLNILTCKRLPFYLSNKDKFLHDYKKRCVYGTLNFSMCSQLGGMLAGAKKADLTQLSIFGRNLGVGLQYMNDLADYAHPFNTVNENRYYQDRVSDLRNGRLTLPLYELIEMDPNIFEIINKGNKLSEDEIQYIINRFLTKRIDKKIIEYCKINVALAKRSLSHFNKLNPQSKLSLMTSVCVKNKYTKWFKSRVSKFASSKQANLEILLNERFL